MASVYVAGLEMRSSGAAPPVWALGAYRLVLDTASRLHADVIPPEPSAGQPSDFFEATATHIESAQAGVTLLSAADPSAAVEAAMLAYSGKPQLIIAEDEADVPLRPTRTGHTNSVPQAMPIPLSAGSAGNMSAWLTW